MSTGILIGMVIDVLLYGLFLLGRKAWRATAPPPVPQPPRTAAQQANATAYDAVQRYHPHVRSMTVRRRTARGRRRLQMERESKEFEE